MKKNLIAILFSIVLILSANLAHADTTNIGIKPLRNEIVLKPGETKTFTLEVSNNGDNTIQAKAILEAITKTDENGYPISSLDDKEISQDQNITKWIKNENETLEIHAKSKKAITLSITAPENATPGGRYAVIYYEPALKNSTGVQIKTRVASLILLTVPGDIKQSGNVEDFSLNENLVYGQPIDFKVTFKNNGNVHLKPNGKITITDSNGNVINQVAKYTDLKTGKETIVNHIPINPFEGNVLPNTSRNFIPSWNENYEKINGKFSAKLELTYSDKTETKEISFEINPNININQFEVIIPNKTKVDKLFKISLENKGNMTSKIDGNIKIFNSLGYNIDAIAFSGADLLPSKSQNFEIKWNKEIPHDDYVAKIELANISAINGTHEAYINLKGSFIENLLNGDIQSIAIAALSVVIIMLLIFNLIPKKKKK